MPMNEESKGFGYTVETGDARTNPHQFVKGDKLVLTRYSIEDSLTDAVSEGTVCRMSHFIAGYPARAVVMVPTDTDDAEGPVFKACRVLVRDLEHARHYDPPLSNKEIGLSRYKSTLPVDAANRKAIPMASGVLDYFPAALAEVAKVSKAGNDQHNPGQDLHWNRSKSSDFADTIIRHLVDRGKVDTDGMRHSAKLAWRALALLQIELEEAGAPKARGAR